MTRSTPGLYDPGTGPLKVRYIAVYDEPPAAEESATIPDGPLEEIPADPPES